MRFITLKTFDNLVEAHILRSNLESENIRCFIFDQNMAWLNPMYSNAVGGIKLKINERGLDRAQEIVRTIEDSPITNESGEIIVCPTCGSPETYSGFKSMKGAKGLLSAIISFLLLVYPFHFKWVYRCKHCGTEFNEN